MSKTTIAGEAVVITSTMKLEDLKTIAKYNKAALTIKEKDEQGNLQPVFTIGVGPVGSIGDFGATFNRANPEGFATITMQHNFPAENIKEKMADQIGGALVYLKRLEESLPAVLEKVKADRKAIEDGISIIA